MMNVLKDLKSMELALTCLTNALVRLRTESLKKERAIFNDAAQVVAKKISPRLIEIIELTGTLGKMSAAEQLYKNDMRAVRASNVVHFPKRKP